MAVAVAVTPGADLTWDDATFTWDDVDALKTWDEAYIASSFLSIVELMRFRWAANDNPTKYWEFLDESAGAEVTVSRASGASRINPAGVLEWMANNTPRWDYDPFTYKSLGLLSENTEINIGRSTEDYTTVSWVPTAVTMTAAAAYAPDMALTATRMMETAATSTHEVDTANYFTFVSGTTYAVSGFVKDNGSGFFQVLLSGAVAYGIAIDLSNGSYNIGSSTLQGGVIKMTNGWYRWWFTFSSPSTAAYQLRHYCARSKTFGAGAPSFLGDITKGVYLWGYNLIASASLSSYVRNTSTSGTATRDADRITFTSLSWLNTSAGSWMIEYDKTAVATYQGLITIWPGSGSTNAIALYDYANSSDRMEIIAASSQTVDTTLTPSPNNNSVNTVLRAGMSYASNDAQIYGNNGSVGTQDVSVTLPSGANQSVVTIGSFWAGTLQGHIRAIAYWNTRQTDEVMKAAMFLGRSGFDLTPGKSLSDSFTMADAISKTPGLNIAEAFSMADVMTDLAAFNLALAEGFTMADAIAKTMTKNIEEVFSLIDKHLKNAAAVLADIGVYSGNVTFAEFQDTYAKLDHSQGFSAFEQFIIGDHRYQRAIFETALQAQLTDDKIEIEGLAVNIDVPDIVDSGGGAVDAAGTLFNFNRSFYVTPEVEVRLKTASGNPGILSVSVTRTGVTVRIPDADNPGSWLTGTVGYLAKGY